MLKRIFVYPYALFMALFIIAPLLIVFWFSITTQGPDGRTMFTLYHYIRFFEGSFEGQPFFDRIFVSVTIRSIRIAVISTLICFVLGYPLAYILAKHYSHSSFMMFLFIVPMWMNFLLRTFAWLTILEQNGVLNAVLSFVGLPTIDILFTDAAVILGMVYNFLPFMILPIYTVLKDMDKTYTEAAQDLGANPRRVFTHVIFPQSIPGVITGFTMVFMPAVTTFIISNLLGGAEFILIGNLIERLFLNIMDWHFGSAVSVIMVVLILVMMGFIKLIDRNPKEKSEESSNRGALYG